MGLQDSIEKCKEFLTFVDPIYFNKKNYKKRKRVVFWTRRTGDLKINLQNLNKAHWDVGLFIQSELNSSFLMAAE